MGNFHAVYIWLSRYSNNKNLNLCLHNKYLLGGLVFKVFKIAFLLCFYVRDNRVFPTGGSPHPAPPAENLLISSTRKNSLPVKLPRHQIFYLPPSTKSSSPPPNPPLNSNFNNSIKTLFLAVVIAPVPFLFYRHTFCTQRSK